MCWLIAIVRLDLAASSKLVCDRWLARRFGLSDEFYCTIIQPFHGIQFTTMQIEHIPAVAFPALDDIVPLTSELLLMLHSWVLMLH